MKNCELCQEEFSDSFVLDGVVKSLKNRKFCLKCSPYKAHNTKNLHLEKIEDGQVERICTKCGITKSLNDFYFDARKNKKYSCCKKCLSQYTISKHQALKLRAIAYKGGKCIICGYLKCSRSLIFHHINDDEKDFSISHDTSRNWERIRIELDKCILLCANCHGEVHSELIMLPLS